MQSTAVMSLPVGRTRAGQLGMSACSLSTTLFLSEFEELCSEQISVMHSFASMSLWVAGCSSGSMPSISIQD